MPLVRPLGTPNVVEADVFPPLRARTQDPSFNFLPFIAEDIAFEEEYEDYLSDLNGDHSWEDGRQSESASAWSRLPELAADLVDGISDSESVVSIGDLGDDARHDPSAEGEPIADDNVNNWEVGSRISFCDALLILYLLSTWAPRQWLRFPSHLPVPVGQAKEATSGLSCRSISTILTAGAL
jgi:hypothetical protein